MLPPLFRIETILSACRANELILTANQRLKSKALQAWGMHQQKLGNSVWRAPRLMTLEQWFSLCWQTLQGQAYQPSNIAIASPEQQRVIWEGITADCGLMQPELIAQQAASGLRMLDRWQLTLSELKNNLSTFSDDLHQLAQHDLDKYSLYKQWCEVFQLTLKKQALITPEQSYRIIGHAFSEQVLPKEKKIHLVGFDDIPPLFQEQLALATSKLINVDLHTVEPLSRIRTTCSDSDTEMVIVAEWAKSIIESDPDSRIGIIVPNLGQCRDKIERALINSFESHSLLSNAERYTYPFNISAGIPLGDTPLIHATFQLLNLTRQTVSVESFCNILFSPFWGKLEEERELRCQLANKLESIGVFEIELSQVRYWAEKLEGLESAGLEGIGVESKAIANKDVSLFQYFNASKQLSDHLQYKDDTSRNNSHKKQLPSVWVDFFLTYLKLLNWPGDRQPDSHEYQQTQLWYQVLEDFCALDNTLGSITLSHAIQQCQRMANHRPFQAQVPDSPIQVLGILEGAGLHFTHCWILGLHQHAWPPAPQPNPLLPLQLQRLHNMPHASSLRELAFASSLTNNYRYCAHHIIFSSPEYDDDSEQLLLSSRLINDIPFEKITVNNQSDFERYSALLHQSQQWEFVDCKQGPPVSNKDLNEKGELGGGANIIKAQSTNPFDAFAIYRLGAKKSLPAVNGFSAIEKGNILHQALATIWETLGDQKALLEMDDTTLNALVQNSVDSQVQLLQRKKPKHLGPALCVLESERQAELVLLWLNKVEKKRPPFTVVAIEDSCQVKLNNIPFTLRLDRVDQLSDGSYLIIDYKTGKTSVNDWQGERPREPQLPLYLITRQELVSGITFAEINIRKQQFTGACRADTYPIENDEKRTKTLPPDIAIEGVKAIDTLRSELPATWETAKAHWTAVINTVFDNFLKGHTEIDYRDASAVNHNKELLFLNRLYDKNRLNDST